MLGNFTNSCFPSNKATNKGWGVGKLPSDTKADVIDCTESKHPVPFETTNTLTWRFLQASESTHDVCWPIAVQEVPLFSLARLPIEPSFNLDWVMVQKLSVCPIPALHMYFIHF